MADMNRPSQILQVSDSFGKTMRCIDYDDLNVYFEMLDSNMNTYLRLSIGRNEAVFFLEGCLRSLQKSLRGRQ